MVAHKYAPAPKPKKKTGKATGKGGGKVSKSPKLPGKAPKVPTGTTNMNFSSLLKGPKQRQSAYTPTKETLKRKRDEEELESGREPKRLAGLNDNPAPREDVRLWHTVREYVLNPPNDGQPKPIANCPICYGELDIPGLSPSKVGQKLKEAAVYVCGHMLCTECHQSWTAKRGTCPYCRKKFKPPGCTCAHFSRQVLPQHWREVPKEGPLRWRRAQMATWKDTEQDGYKIPEVCGKCSSDEGDSEVPDSQEEEDEDE
ncbi:hypothetical protein B0T22DRAFT_440272 [Podospora appendiculata]|uniref:RING-type domain-containing protein n=1 Tax=Podospora appendiculata TaxID=314037 RepID=A0AAE1CCQ5_9PEZI|nr:hypothetical protein B0T22DRAFT_440272 [Podospora appendiculata]